MYIGFINFKNLGLTRKTDYSDLIGGTPIKVAVILSCNLLQVMSVNDFWLQAYIR